MNITREQIYSTVFAKFSGLTFLSGTDTTFALTSRKLQHWEDVEVESFPALFQIQTQESVQQVRGLPPKWTLGLSLYIYVRTMAQQDDSVIPTQLLNPILDAVDNALRPDNLPVGTCTLGGLVSHAWISGPIETSEGLLGDIEVAIIPIEIVVPS